MNFRVPFEVHSRAKSAASLRGQGIQDFALEAIESAVIAASKTSEINPEAQ